MGPASTSRCTPLLVLVVGPAVLVARDVGQWARRQVDIDVCLDGGGCWDHAKARCTDHQPDCHRRHLTKLHAPP